MSNIESLMSDPQAARLYEWETSVAYRRFPSPLSLTASRTVLREVLGGHGYAYPRVRPLSFLDPKYSSVQGAVGWGMRIYLRPWVNKAVVLHEAAHYMEISDGRGLDHGPDFLDRYFDLLTQAGHSDLRSSAADHGVFR